MRPGAAGFRVGPGAKYANSVVTVLPTTTAPAARSRATATDSAPASASGGRRLPARVVEAVDAKDVLDADRQPEEVGLLLRQCGQRAVPKRRRLALEPIPAVGLGKEGEHFRIALVEGAAERPHRAGASQVLGSDGGREGAQELDVSGRSTTGAASRSAATAAARCAASSTASTMCW